MKKFRPFIILFLILGLPLVVYVFMRGFSVQHYKPIKILSPKYANPDGSLDSLYKTVGDFSFINQNGETVNRAMYNDKIWVADVFFTTCPGICPKLSNGLHTIQDYFKDDAEVMFLSISVDPETDSVPALRAYADQYEAIDGKWNLITGNKEKLYKFAHEEFFFSATEDENEEIKFVHDNTIRLIDKEGRFRGMYYDGTNQFEVDSVISHIKLLKLEYAEQKR